MADPLANLGSDVPNVGGDTDNWGTILNSLLDDVDGAAAGHGSKSVAGAVDVTLTAAEAMYAHLTLTGALTGNINVILPRPGIWVIYNNTSGSFTLTVKGSAGGTGVLVSQGTRAQIAGDGTNAVHAVNHLDLTGGTLTLDNDSISGDKIDGGTISNFTSTGIDDNATKEVIDITDGALTLGDAANANFVIDMVDDDQSLVVGGGTTPGTTGASLTMYGGTHASVANDILFKAGSTDVLRYDHDVTTWNFQANNIVTTGNFTSVGIDDNAVGTAITIDASNNTAVLADLSAVGATTLGTGAGTGDAIVNLGAGRTGDGNVYIDFHSEETAGATYPDYNLRLIHDPGPNGGSVLYHRGTGALGLHTVDAADITFSVNAAEKGRFTGNGLSLGTTSTSGGSQLWSYVNNANTIPQVLIEQDGAGDAALQFSLAGADWSIGADNSDSDGFSIAVSNNLSSSKLFNITTAGEIQISNNIKGMSTTAAFSYGVDSTITNGPFMSLFPSGHESKGDIVFQTNSAGVYPEGTIFDYDASGEEWSFRPGNVTRLRIRDLANAVIMENIDSNYMHETYASLAAAGTTQGDAAAVVRAHTTVTSGTGGVRLPSAVGGETFKIYNRTGSAINVYPATSDEIKNQALNTPYSLAAGACIILFAVNAITWGYVVT
jgi:hypothetical protein